MQTRDSSPPSTPVASQVARDALAKGRAQVAANLTFAVALQNLGEGLAKTSLQGRRRVIGSCDVSLGGGHRWLLSTVGLPLLMSSVVGIEATTT